MTIEEILNITLKNLPDVNDAVIMIDKDTLLSVNKSSIKTPFSNNLTDLFSYKAPINDQLFNVNFLRGILNDIKRNGYYKRLNHIGFCYKVKSKEDEITRIGDIISQTEFSAFQEPSNDDGAWIFVGKLANVESTLLEFLPNEGGTSDKWEDYWLPHIHVDIDTNLSPDEISHLTRKYTNNPHIPYSIKIDGVCYIQRVRLGCHSGVSFYLDMGTNNRDINYRRTWKKLTDMPKYDPPYNPKQIRKNYPKFANKLLSDPVHKWRAETGIELIHKEPSKKELDRIWRNWQLMTKEQKRRSDEKSKSLFGLTNEENYKILVKEY